MKLLQSISRLDSHHRLFIALAVAVGVFGFLPNSFAMPTRLVITWLGFSLTSLLLTWTALFLAHPLHIRSFYQMQDSSRTLIFLFVLVAAFSSLFAVIGLLSKSQNMSELSRHSFLCILAIISSWSLVHTIFTIRYAHLYYDREAGQLAKGLEFPGDEEPDYLDFAYFSFIIGMTSQVSDVAISSKPIRRLALLHGILAFVFNAVIIALSINTLSGLLQT
ncbi:DUF1345 domain-containing protein [Tellurirhabdus bombi]|uniref:DUF1345 domain-containing protein n=1 Tax=Tellurirhabdus bombi TaxID=2907205 RepID=UPI001F38D43A|nr:DUF1345 domain-containing protein [Tellurirhabdus bombi]